MDPTTAASAPTQPGADDHLEPPTDPRAAMLVVVQVPVSAASLDDALTHLARVAPAVRALDGCDSFAFYQDASARSFAIVQRWASAAAFAGYRASDEFAAMGAALRILMSGPPVTTVARIAES